MPKRAMRDGFEAGLGGFAKEHGVESVMLLGSILSHNSLSCFLCWSFILSCVVFDEGNLLAR